jgi:hypothetical protein
MEQAEDVESLAPVPVFADDTGRRRKLTRRVGRVLLVGSTAYIGLLVLGFASDPRLGPLHLPTIGFPDLGLMIPPAPLVLGEQTTRSPSEAGIEVSTAGASDGDVGSAPSSGGSGTGTPGRSTSPSGVAPAPGSAPTGRPPGSGTTTTSTSTTTTTTSIRGASPTSSTTTPTTTAPSTPSTTSPTTPGQGPVSAKGPDGSGPPGQQRRTTTTTGR